MTMSSVRSAVDRLQHLDLNADPRWVVMVPGMHRSGTSVTTKLLSLLGGTLPSRLMPANDSNPEGYFEPIEIAAIHDQILKSVGSSWLDWRPLPIQWFRSDAATPFIADLTAAFDVDFHKSELPLLKDPRLCRLFHVWRDVFAQQGRRIFCVMPYRNPIDVVASLVARDKLDPYHANLLYLRYSLDAEIASRDLPRIFVPYEKIVTDPVSALERVGSESPFAWPNDLGQTADAMRSAIKVDLRHNKAATSALGDRSNTPAWVHSVYECYRALENDRASVAAFKELDRIRLALDHVSHSSTPFEQAIDWKVFSDPQASSEGVHSRLLTLRNREIQADIASTPSELRVGPWDASGKSTDVDQSNEDGAQKTRRMGYLYAALGHSTNVIQQKDALIGRLEKQVAGLRTDWERRESELVASQKELQVTQDKFQAAQDSVAALQLEKSELVTERDHLLDQLLVAKADHKAEQQKLSAARLEIDFIRTLFFNSTSWRLTRPLRAIKQFFAGWKGA